MFGEIFDEILRSTFLNPCISLQKNLIDSINIPLNRTLIDLFSILIICIINIVKIGLNSVTSDIFGQYFVTSCQS